MEERINQFKMCCPDAAQDYNGNYNKKEILKLSIFLRFEKPL